MSSTTPRSTVAVPALRERRKRGWRIALTGTIAAGVATGVTINIVELGPVLPLTAFTVQSNLLAALLAVVTLARVARGHEEATSRYVLFKGMAMTAVLLTFVIFNAVLRFTIDQEMTAAGQLADNLLHVVVPLLVLAEFLFFEHHPSVRPWHPVAWAAFPWYYVAFTAVFISAGGVYTSPAGTERFPYFFLDYLTYGWATVVLWVLLITVCFVGAGFALMGVDRLIGRRRSARAVRQHA
jgi:hypothetical protein